MTINVCTKFPSNIIPAEAKEARIAGKRVWRTIIAVNNITQMTDSAGAHNYSYDPVDRLTAATHANQTNESYTFDAVGNRTASHQGSSYSYQPFNRLIMANSSSFSYDANGNLISKSDASGSWTYSWDYENRLKLVGKGRF